MNILTVSSNCCGVHYVEMTRAVVFYCNSFNYENQSFGWAFFPHYSDWKLSHRYWFIYRKFHFFESKFCPPFLQVLVRLKIMKVVMDTRDLLVKKNGWLRIANESVGFVKVQSNFDYSYTSSIISSRMALSADPLPQCKGVVYLSSKVACFHFSSDWGSSWFGCTNVATVIWSVLVDLYFCITL